MASLAQTAATPHNSLRSTGSTPAAGKAVTRFNALKSGIDAKSLIIPGEDPAELEALATNYHFQFLPGSPVEQFLVDSLTHTDWKLRRLRKREAELLTPAAGDSIDEKQLDRLDRQIHTAQRAWFRALKELQNQIPARIEKELAEIEAARDQATSAAKALAPEPTPAAEIGFVPSEIDSAPLAPALAVPSQPQTRPAVHPQGGKTEPKINLALRL
jgi:hypothetical protein